MAILHGNCLDVLKTLDAESVQMCVTSPPYWALRRYDIPDVIWGGDDDCDHEWASFIRKGKSGGLESSVDYTANQIVPDQQQQQQCSKCAAWRGQLGQEPTPELFIAHLVEIFREVRRVLRDDGICFINMGDCYAQSGMGGNPAESHFRKQATNAGSLIPGRKAPAGMKPKDLVGIPWMLAFALRADGWYLRAEIVWAKGLSFCESYAGSVMPESVTDRPTRSHEQLFLLTKNERYFYDHEAVKEKGVYPAGTIAAKGSGTREGNRRAPRKKDAEGVRAVSTERRRGGSFQDRVDQGYACYDGTRNLRTVWAIGVEPFHEAHFATYPPSLVDPCIRAGTSEKGACASCGAPWERIVEYEPLPDDIKAQFEAARQQTAENHGRDDGFTTRRPNYQRKRIGERWERTCDCETTEVVPCAVLDPFAGSGTTGVACELQRRKFLGIDLGYHDLSERRINAVAPLFAEHAS
jgi:DNA modification methylase